MNYIFEYLCLRHNIITCIYNFTIVIKLYCASNNGGYNFNIVNVNETYQQYKEQNRQLLTLKSAF